MDTKQKPVSPNFPSMGVTADVDYLKYYNIHYNLPQLNATERKQKRQKTCLFETIKFQFINRTNK